MLTVLLLLGVFSVQGLFSPGVSQAAGQNWARQIFGTANVGNPEIQKKLQLAKANQEFYQRVQAKVAAYREHERWQQKIRDYPAGEKIAAFLDALRKEESKGVNTKAMLKSLSDDKKVLFKIAQTGSISGTVTVNGVLSTQFIQVFAFDSFGFFAGSASLDDQGNYTISGLAAGSYYVVTRSPFVDEFYNNVIVGFFRNWRDADLVTVTEGSPTSNIDFDLQTGASISGALTIEDGGVPLPFISVTFEIFPADNPEPLFVIPTTTDINADYQIFIPATGRFKIKAVLDNFVDEFYNNKSDFASADVIEITSLSDEFTNINFSVLLGNDGVTVGSQITGTVLGESEGGLDPVSLALVFAFNTADTSIAGLALAGFDGSYQLGGLAAGSYILFANHLLDFLLLPAVIGEYYQDAPTPDLADPITVSGSDTTEGINFTLPAGGAISGNITDATGAALDGLLVLAIRVDLAQIDKFFVDDVDLGITFSDPDGNYTIAGLSQGGYYVRTISLIGSDLSIPGPLFGQVLDEYYDNVQGLFDIANATLVPVAPPDTTSGINFELDLAGAISGHFFESDGSTPVSGTGIAIAFNADTGLPELALTNYDSLHAAFEIRPLPSGTFILLGLVNSDEVLYLPQFYNGKSNPEDADPITVTAPDITSGIDFRMVRAGAIQGRVNIASNFPVGADSLSQTLVIAYDVTQVGAPGFVAGGSDVTFAGGFRINGLAPGRYKIAALTAADGYAGTYSGGGTTFDDPNSAVIEVDAGATTSSNIDLATGEETISGNVTDKAGNPIAGVLVLAYDATGHAVSAGVSGFDISSQQPLPNPGEYHIQGLRPGSYYVRTFALFRLISFLQDSNFAGGDLLSLLLGLLTGGGGVDIVNQISSQLFGDLYYPDVVVQIDLNRSDIFRLLFSLFLGGGDIGALIPFFHIIPDGAQVVAASSTGINFALPSLQDVLTDVSENPGNIIPTAFELAQNYPNPFNPSTVIRYSVANPAEVKLAVFNLLGQRIRLLFEGRREAGTFSIQWDGRNDKGEQVAAGIYFLRLDSERATLSRKMLLVR
jgi:hypothetical protein